MVVQVFTIWSEFI